MLELDKLAEEENKYFNNKEYDKALENMDNEKLNIENTETIDSIAYEQDTEKLLMLISDGMDWSDINRHMFLLQSKLNSYIRYIDTKQFLEYIERVREKIGLDELPKIDTIEIRIGFLFKEPQICNDFIEKTVKPKITELFNNVDIVIEHGTKY